MRTKASPPPIDGKTFMLVIPSFGSMTAGERQMAESGLGPVRVTFPSAEAAVEAATVAMTGKPGKERRVRPEPESSPRPSLDSLLKAALRDTVREEIASAIREIPRPPMPANSQVPNTSERLTVEDAAAELKITRGTVREWIKAGDLKASRVGPEGKARIYSVARADLDDFLHRRRVNPAVHDIDTQANEILQTLDADEAGGK